MLTGWRLRCSPSSPAQYSDQNRPIARGRGEPGMAASSYSSRCELMEIRGVPPSPRTFGQAKRNGLGTRLQLPKRRVRDAVVGLVANYCP